MIIIERWDEEMLGEMSRDSVEASLPDPTWVRISEYRYPAGTQHPGWSRQGQVFVLAGGCRYSLPSGATTSLRAGDIATLPQGDYVFEVEGDEDFEAVMVWQLPAAFRPGVATLIRSKALRILGPLPAFSEGGDAPNDLDGLIGAYQVEPDGDRIWITESGLVREAPERTWGIVYSDLAEVRAPTSKNQAERASRLVRLVFKDGRVDELEIAGGGDRTCDSFEFSRFLSGVVRLVQAGAQG